MTDHVYDVAVIGAGIAGSSLAKSLADRGLDTILLDRKSFPRHKVCGEFMSPESLATLREMGLDSVVSELGPVSIERVHLHFEFGDAIDIPLPGPAWGISRYALDSALHRAATCAGAKLLTGTTVVSVSPAPNSGGYDIVAKQKDGISSGLCASIVISAWGTASLKGLAGQQPARRANNGHIGVKSHFSGIETGPVIELYFFDGGYLGISPIEGGLTNVAALMNRSVLASPDADKSVAGWIEAACSRNPKLRKRLSQGAAVAGTQAAVAPVQFNRRPVAWDTIPRVGDSSMMIPPLCGDGMSMALRSAQLCSPLAASYIKGEIQLSQWKQHYAEAVEKEFVGPLKWGRTLQKLLDLPLMPRILHAAAKISPRLPYKMVEATRLK